MMPRSIFEQICDAVHSLGGVMVNPTITDHSIGVVIGGTFFGIEWRQIGSRCEGCAEVEKAVNSAGGKWIAISAACSDIESAIRNGVHYSTAQTADNIDASIQHWCEHFSLNITNDQAAMLKRLMTPGGSPC